MTLVQKIIAKTINASLLIATIAIITQAIDSGSVVTLSNNGKIALAEFTSALTNLPITVSAESIYKDIDGSIVKEGGSFTTISTL